MAKAKELADLTQKKAVVIGAGEMGELAAKHLIAAGAKVIILNRDLQKAKDLCERLGVLSEYDSLEKFKKIFKSIRVFFLSYQCTKCYCYKFFNRRTFL